MLLVIASPTKIVNVMKIVNVVHLVPVVMEKFDDK